MIEHVIFDCDGVLVDTEIVAAQVVVDTLIKYNIEISVDHYIKTYTGSTFSGTFRKLLPHLNDNEISEIVRKSEESVYDSLVSIKGMKSVVESIQLPKSVVSNSYLWQVKKAMKVTQLSNYFNHLFSAEMVPNPKPDPDVYLLAAKTNKIDPSNCLVIEDSKSGATSALAAGMTVIGFTGGSHILDGHGDDLIKKGVVSVANSPKKLLQEINKFI